MNDVTMANTYVAHTMARIAKQRRDEMIKSRYDLGKKQCEEPQVDELCAYLIAWSMYVQQDSFLIPKLVEMGIGCDLTLCPILEQTISAGTGLMHYIPGRLHVLTNVSGDDILGSVMIGEGGDGEGGGTGGDGGGGTILQALEPVKDFIVGDPGAPMIDGDTAYPTAGSEVANLLKDHKVWVFADGRKLPDKANEIRRYISYDIATGVITFHGGVSTGEWIEIYRWA